MRELLSRISAHALIASFGEQTQPLRMPNVPGGIGAALLVAACVVAAVFAVHVLWSRRRHGTQESDGYTESLDPLTQLPGRGRFSRWKWGSGDFLGLIDIDRLEAINRIHGRAVGDAILADTGEVLRRAVAAGYLRAAWRIGGDRFALAISAMPSNMAARLFDVLRGQISAQATETASGVTHQITATGGMTRVRNGRVDQALEATEQLLAMAKEDGRDRLSHNDDDFPISSACSGNLHNQSS